MRGNLPKFGREEGKNKIILLFKKRTEEGKTPTKEFIEKKLHISLYTYFPRGIKELYKITGINLLPKLRDREGLKCEIISYVKSQVKKGHYPTYEETNEKFNTNLNKLFSNIFELYKLANIVYKREPNPFIKYKKEEKLAQICKKIFQKKGYKIKDVSIGPSTKGGADIVLLNKNKELVPIELKAYHKYGRVGTNKNCPSNYFGNEIKQLREYIKRLKSPYGYLITTTSRVCKKPSSIVKILVYEDLKELLIRYNFTGELENLEWIRNTHPSGNKELMIKSIRREIVSYIQKEFKRGIM